MRMQKSKRRSRRFRKSRKNRTRRRYPRLHDKNDLLRDKKLKGGQNTSPVEPTALISCCVCDNEFPRDEMMVPGRCLRKNRDRAHRICQNCWWNPETGFARENAPHECPGCKRGLPLNPPLKSRPPREEDIITLSSDEE
jgi:hypothetical protein